LFVGISPNEFLHTVIFIAALILSDFGFVNLWTKLDGDWEGNIPRKLSGR
jgi:hypothetical protein